MNKLTLSFFACGLTLTCPQAMASDNGNLCTLFVGTYTQTDSKGIYRCVFNQDSGEYILKEACRADNPSFVTISPDKRTLYAVNESGSDSDCVTSFRIDSKSHILSRLNSEPARAMAPCYISTDGRFVFTANYGSGSISVFPLGHDGLLRPLSQQIRFSAPESPADTTRQLTAHVHCVRLSPDSTFLLVSDLGNDCIYHYDIDTSSLRPLSLVNTYSLAPGSGPRHIVFSNDARFVYVITELSGEVVVFAVGSDGLRLVQTVTCDHAHARGSADIHISPDGRHLYASNRLKDDSITIFDINTATGRLTEIGSVNTLRHPRNFAITPNGEYLLCACRDDNTIQVFSRDTCSGMLTDTGNRIDIPMPVCLLFCE